MTNTTVEIKEQRARGKLQISKIKEQRSKAKDSGISALCSLLFALCSLLFVSQAFATKYADDFEELGVSARAVGMGSAFVAVGDDPAAMYYNPSASALLDKKNVMLMHAENFGGLVTNDFVSLVMPTGQQALGFGLLHNGVSDIKLTALPNPALPVGAEFVDTSVVVRDTVVNGRTYHTGDTLIGTVLNTPYVTQSVNAADWVFYFNYARPISEHFVVGGNAKLVYRSTGASTCFGMGLDLGATVVLVKDFNIGLRVRNLSTSPLFWDTKTRESMDPRPVLGIAKGFSLGQDHHVLLSIEGEGNFEGLPIEENIGAEYQFRKLLSGRVGFHHGNFTFGIGAAYKAFYLDYAYETAAYSDATELPASQKIAGGIRF